VTTPLDGVDLVLADLDGVIYRGPQPIEYAVESMNAIELPVAYLTNNASRTDASVAAHLTALGLHTTPDRIVTSPQAATRLLAGLVPAGSAILVVGGDGLTTEVEKAGFTVVRSADDAPAAVVQGFAPEVGWRDLAEAAYAIQRGIPWVATNTDWTLPQERGTAPGNGTLVSAVHTAVGILPIVAGKPEVPIFEEATARFGAKHPLMLGDRLDTDILGANRAGMPSVLVLTGIDGPKQLLAAVPDQRPTFILEDLRGLHEQYPPTIVDGELTTVGGATVRRAGNTITVERGSGLDLLRAGAATIWASGQAIYGLQVPPELYS
jgi:HAD superfamily hydrolase (TIGR01450 family)